MAIVKIMSRLGFALLVMTSTAAVSAEGDLYWAVSGAAEYIGDNKSAYRVSTYGAAWDFSSAEEAEEAALEACQQRVPDPWNDERWLYGGCNKPYAYSNSCFAIIKEIIHDEYLGTVVQYNMVPEVLLSRAEAEAAAARRVAHIVGNRGYGGRYETAEIELIECAGVE